MADIGLVVQLSPKLAKSPKVVSDAIKSVMEDSPQKRGRGRPRKETNGSASPPTSPMRWVAPSHAINVSSLCKWARWWSLATAEM